MQKLRWNLRPGTPEDRVFVFSSFLRSYVDTLPGPARAQIECTCRVCGKTTQTPVASLRLPCPSCAKPVSNMAGEKDSVRLDLGDYQELHRDMEARLAHDRLLVACSPEDPSLILGWALFNEKDAELVYVYVKQNYRGQGIATDLLGRLISPPCRVVYPYATRSGTQLLLRLQDAMAPGRLTFCYLP